MNYMFMLVFVLTLLYCLRSLAKLDQKCPGVPKCDCNRAITTVYCRDRNFSSIPQIPRTARRLHLEDNDLMRIPTHGFANLSALTDIFLTNNKISNIEPYAFEGLEKLKYIGLAANKLSRVNNHSFANITNLQILNLFNNRIERVADNAFYGTSSISKIDLEANQLPHIPSLGHQPLLRELNLHKNIIVNAKFPSSFKKTTREIGISLSSNMIHTLQNATFHSLSKLNLTYLHLSDNKIEYVDIDAFAEFSAIVALRLKHNPLTRQSLKNIAIGLSRKSLMSLDLSGIFYNNEQVRDFLNSFRSVSLKQLRLRENSISALTDNMFVQIGQLNELDLAKNKIASVQEKSFSGLTSLMTLNLVDNSLEYVPNGLPSSLQELYLNKNKISEIKVNIFKHLFQLKRLILRENQIVNLEKGAFNGVTGLMKLDLAGNKIRQIPGSLFIPLRNLTHLDISNNKLKSIRFSKNRFKSLVSLRVFNMADNQCSYVQENIFQSMKYLEILNLVKNKLRCLFTGKNAGTTLKGLKHLKEIYITNSNLSTISDSVFKDQTALKVLKAGDNKLSEFSPDLFKFTENLTYLDLSQNKISVLHEGNMKYLHALQNLNLVDNPFFCDCALLWFREWMDRTKVVLLKAGSYKCNGPKKWNGKRLFDFNRNSINCLFVSKYAIIGALLAGVACSLFLVMCVYKNRWRLRLRLYLISKRGKRFFRNIRAENRHRNYGTINDNQESFNAYISCSEQDKPWALQQLLPGIDNGRLNDDNPFGGDFKLYYDDRDSEPGVSIVANIFENMARSRKVIAVLTRHYYNGMNEFELDQATALLHEHELDDIIVIKVGDVPARSVPPHLYAQMRNGSFIEWEDDENAINTFKEKLKDRLRNTPDPLNLL